MPEPEAKRDEYGNWYDPNGQLHCSVCGVIFDPNGECGCPPF